MHSPAHCIDGFTIPYVQWVCTTISTVCRPMKSDHPRPLEPGRPGGRHRMTPIAMDRIDWLTQDQVEAAQRIALSIFTDMSNANFSLREALAAVYFSGLSHAVSVITKEKDE
jgi:hypothetical protein